MKLKKANTTFYDFYRDGVTQSMIQMWLELPQACKLSYVDGWTPIDQSDAITYGNIVHWILENGYSQLFPPPNGVLTAWINETKDAYKLDADELSVEQIQQNEVTLAKAEAIMRAYWKVNVSDFEYTWEITESVFKVPYTFKDGRKTYITGKLDGGFENNDLEIMDHKTMGMINWEHILTLLPVDLQLNVYVWAVRELMEKTPKNFWYNIIRNPQKKPSIRKNESIEQFIERLEDAAIKERDTHFYRMRIPINDATIDKFKREQLDPIMAHMRNWWDSGCRYPNYINVERLKTRFGLNPYTEAILTNDFSRLYQRHRPFQELH